MLTKKIIVTTLRITLIVVLMVMIPSTTFADGTETYEDALGVLDVALDTGDFVAIGSLIHDKLGFIIAGQEVAKNRFIESLHDASIRDLRFVTADGIASLEMSFEDFLWGDDGAFTVMAGVTLSHYVEIERDELFSDATMDLWEHGELEVVIIQPEPDIVNVYIFPDLIYKVMLLKIDGYWYLSGIAARMESS